MDSLVFLPPPEVLQESGYITGEIIHIDGFGNLVTNITESHLPGEPRAISIEVGKHLICGMSRTYGEGKGLLALVGSSGYVEISLKGGNAKKFLKVTVGSKVTVRLSPDASFRLLV